MKLPTVRGGNRHAKERGRTTSRTTPLGRASTWLAGLMACAVVLVATLAFWDQQREAARALDDFAREQATLAQSVAATVAMRLATAHRDALIFADDAEAGRWPSPQLRGSYGEVSITRAAASSTPLPSANTGENPFAFALPLILSEGRRVTLRLTPKELIGASSGIDRPGTEVLLIRAPQSQGLRATDGHWVNASAIVKAFDEGVSSLRLTRTEAANLGLPSRTALAGLAHVDGGPYGPWGVAVVTTAQVERDREIRGIWRLMLGVGIASGLVLAFGGFALSKQRSELEVKHDLEVVTLREQKDERLERATKAAVLGTLATGIAHEIATPLGVIMGRAEQLISRAESDEKAKFAVKTIIEQAERIHQVVRGFLGLARGGRPEFHRHLPRQLADETVDLVSHRFDKAGIRLVTRIPGDLPAVSCDARLLEHALVNLLLNACDASEAGDEVVLHVSSDGEQVAFVVTDQGIGIREEDAARVTEPFFTTKPEGQGSGLGLAIANEIVALHRGTLAVSPQQPRGTRALFYVPVIQGETRAVK